MDPVVAAAGANAAGQLLGGALGSGSQAKAGRDARRWQEKMWNLQNAYNAPIEQRKRMEAAGFNPNLIYGHGSVANTAGDVGSPNEVPATAMGEGVRGAGEAISNGLIVGAQLKMQKEALASQNAVRDAQISNYKAQEDATRTNTAGKLLSNEFDSISFGDRLSMVKQNLKNNIETGLGLEIGNAGQLTKNYGYELDNELRRLQITGQRLANAGTITKNQGYALDNIIKGIQGSYLEKEKQVQLTKMLQEIVNLKEARNVQQLEAKKREINNWMLEQGVSEGGGFFTEIGRFVQAMGNTQNDMKLKR